MVHIAQFRQLNPHKLPFIKPASIARHMLIHCNVKALLKGCQNQRQMPKWDQIIKSSVINKLCSIVKENFHLKGILHFFIKTPPFHQVKSPE